MLISIEGNIGTGKTTLINILKEKYKSNINIVFIEEPIKEWLDLKDKTGKNILDKFYNSQERWSYTFQMHAFITRAKKIMNYRYKDKIIVIDRSILTDRYVFAELLREQKKIDDIEWALYNEWFNWLSNEFTMIRPVNFIYLKANPQVSYKRIQQRTRDEESSIPISYIVDISNKHDSWLLSKKNVTVIDANDDFVNNVDTRDNIIKTVSEIINPNLDKISKSSSESSLEDMINIVTH